MTMNSTSGSSSTSKDGKLKSGIYKIQNIQSETYLDIEVPSREACCRPATDLGEGRGIVSRHLCWWFVADDFKVGNQRLWGGIYDKTSEHADVVR